MISKKQFVKIINRLKDTDDFVKETNNRARKLQDSIESAETNAMGLAISHESIVVELLEDMFNDSDYISWWLYDLEYGRDYKDGCIQDADGKIIDLSTPEKLYDFLVENV